ncbi:MAG TPA: NIPSNAP family protein, partial [Cytophagales bacterium]
FRKHGMTNVGYWVPLENPDNRLVYILAYPSKEARDKSWKDFGADPEWQSVQKASEANGKLVDRVESIFMRRTDYSPKIAPATGKSPRVFQLRTYTATAGKLPNVHARFRDHTVKLFRKHGMTNVGYWEVIPKDGGEPNTLIYVLAHPSKEAGEASFSAFRADPNWTKAKAASEANGPIVDKVEAVYMAATDYSPVK